MYEIKTEDEYFRNSKETFYFSKYSTKNIMMIQTN